jgi:hypothetical protein
VVSSHSGTPLGVGTSHGHFGPRDTPRPGPREYATTILPIVYSVTLGGTHARMSLFPGTPGTPGLESRNCPGRSPRTLGAHNSRLRHLIATRSEPNLYPASRSFQRRIAISIRSSGRGRFPTFSGRESNCQFDSRPLLLPITWATDVQMANARPFSTSTLQDLSNDTKNISMQGVLGLAVEL